MRNSPGRGTENDLASWLKIQSASKPVLIGLIVLGTFQAGFVYFDLLLLSKLFASFIPGSGPPPEAISGFDRLSGDLASRIALDITYVLLGIYCFTLTLRAFIVFGRQWLEGLLDISSRSDIEREIFRNLLRKDEQFFQHHSLAEVTNRLAMDIEQVLELRRNYVQLWFAFVTITGSVYFFLQQGFLIAAIGVGTIVLGVVFSNFLQRAMPMIYGQQLKADDAVKSTFEEYLAAAPEIQIGNLHAHVVNKLKTFQTSRWKIFMRRTSLQGKLGMNYMVSYMLSFLAIVVTLLLDGKPQLIPVVIRAFPELHGNISDIGSLIMRIKLSAPSLSRLLEYASPQPAQPTANEIASSPEASDVRVEGVNYRYASDKPLLGGPDGINAVLPAKTLISLVGSSGSGKSTLCQMILGVMEPERGTITIGDRQTNTLSDEARSATFAYMPQSNVLLDTSIFENLTFGSPRHSTNASDLSPTEMETLNQIGVSRIALTKALEMHPQKDFDFGGLTVDIANLRAGVQKRVRDDLDLQLDTFGPNAAAPNNPLIFHMLGGSIDSQALLAMTETPAGTGKLTSLFTEELANSLVEIAGLAMQSTQELLARFRDADAYNRVAPVQLEPANWKLRSRLAMFARDPNPPAKAREALIVVGLLVAPSEIEDEELTGRLRSIWAQDVSALPEVLNRDLSIPVHPFTESQIDPRLTWRDNLLFAVSSVPQQRKNSEIDRILLETVKDTPIEDVLIKRGFSYNVGKGGRSLSGGQRQMICLGRTLLRGSAIYILDEPTAALDPHSRQRVHEFLTRFAERATVLAITHDDKLAKMSGEVVMMRDGGLHAMGHYDDLARDNALFRDIIDNKGD